MPSCVLAARCGHGDMPRGGGVLLHAVVVTQAGMRPCDSGLVHGSPVVCARTSHHHATHRSTAILIMLFDDRRRAQVLQYGLDDTQPAITEKGQWIDNDQMGPTHCL